MQLITTSCAAKILQTSEGTVRALERRGELPATRTSSGVRLFDPAVVERLAEERKRRRTRATRATNPGKSRLMIPPLPLSDVDAAIAQALARALVAEVRAEQVGTCSEDAVTAERV